MTPLRMYTPLIFQFQNGQSQVEIKLKYTAVCDEATAQKASAPILAQSWAAGEQKAFPRRI
jgi:hypothetical protein